MCSWRSKIKDIGKYSIIFNRLYCLWASFIVHNVDFQEHLPKTYFLTYWLRQQSAIWISSMCENTWTRLCCKILHLAGPGSMLPTRRGVRVICLPHKHQSENWRKSVFGRFPWTFWFYCINEAHKQYSLIDTILNYVFYFGPPGQHLYSSPQNPVRVGRRSQPTCSRFSWLCDRCLWSSKEF